MRGFVKRLQALERQACPNSVLLVMASGRKRPIAADSILEVHQALMKRAEEWDKGGGSFPLPDYVIRSIPLLLELLGSVRIERDLAPKFPNIPVAPVIASIKLLTERAPREISQDEDGKFMMLPAVCGPIRICFVTPDPKRFAVH